MFKSPKRKKRYPAGTFIAMPARIFAILQLSLAFALLFWYAGIPFMGEVFSYKSRLSVFQIVMGSVSSQGDEGLQAKLARHRERFEALPASEQEKVIQEYRRLLETGQPSLIEKLTRSLTIVLFGIPTFEMAWLCLSIIIPIMLLLKFDSAREAAWLLPLVAAVYACDAAAFRSVGKDDSRSGKFPSEQLIVEKYLGQPLSNNIFEQHRQLKLGWLRYLADEWAAGEIPEEEPLLLKQAEEGEFAFYLAQARDRGPSHHTISSFKPPLLLAFYFLWNLAFAWAQQFPRTKKAVLLLPSSSAAGPS